MFASHLHVHSAYSFLRGLATPEQLARAAAAAGMGALALTDHHSLTGAVEFYDACLAAGIKPILGLEARVQFPQMPAWRGGAFLAGNLVLLAEDERGWRSLCRAASRIDPEADELPFEVLAGESEGLLCLTGGRSGALEGLLRQGERKAAGNWLGALGEVFPGRLYAEICLLGREDQAVCGEIARLAHSRELPLTAAVPVHYLQPEQAGLQRVVSAIRVIKPLAELSEADCAPPGAWFVSPAEMEQRYAAFPRALAGTTEAAERCNCSLPVGAAHFPQLDLPAGQTAVDVVRAQAYAGALELYGSRDTANAETLPENVSLRLEHELGVIAQTGYAVLFLIVQDILNYARATGVPTASRGSASSSLVAHCLGITTPDPLALNLYFERFLNPARHSPPDIDTDLCSRRRESIIRYVYQRFGEERVATVCTIACFRSRSALREVAKAYGLESEEVKALADALPYRWYGPPNRRSGSNDPYEELKERFTTQPYLDIFRDASALIGLPHHLSVHPGGLVIAPGAMDDLAPTVMATKGVRITQFDLESVERLGLVKIDLLGIRGLTVTGDVAEAVLAARPAGLSPIHENSGIEGRVGKAPSRTKQVFGPIAPSLQVLAEIPEVDAGVSEMLLHGRTIGCFQIESPGMRATLKEVRARSVEDILVALALYRPGPLTGGLKDAFVRRHLKKEPTTYLHPALEPLLSETYGVILYQEQVLRIAHELAGFSLAEADLLRRAMSHFDPGKQMQTLQEKFIREAAVRSGLKPETSQRIWELMAAFAGYGFPKAHAASYAQVAWRAAWCKLYHPALFMAAVLANWGGYYSQRVYLTESRRMGLTVRPPDINHARREFSLRYVDSKPLLFMGLDQVKGLTQRTMERIVRCQPFTSLDDFLARADPRRLEAENLIKAGAVSELGTIPALLDRLAGKRPGAGQLSFFGLEVGAASEGEDWSRDEKVRAQEELLGVSVIAHPLELAAAAIERSRALNTVEAAAHLGQRVRVAGMRQTWRRSVTTRGDYVYFLALEDLEGMLNVVIFGDVYRRWRQALTTAGPYIVEGVVEFDEEQGEPFIRAEKIEKL